MKFTQIVLPLDSVSSLFLFFVLNYVYQLLQLYI